MTAPDTTIFSGHRQEKYRPAIQCAYQGCDRWVWARGYCANHLQKLRKVGKLEKVRVTGDTRRRFYDGFTVNPETLCWEWQKSKISNGYGCIGIGAKKKERIHRYSYELFYGPIPEGLQILHACDNRICGNPAHLFAGTGEDNMQDCVQKTRHAGQLGTNLPKITPQMALNIRIMYARGQHTMAEIGRIYCLQQNTVSGIIKGRSHVGKPRVYPRLDGR